MTDLERIAAIQAEVWAMAAELQQLARQRKAALPAARKRLPQGEPLRPVWRPVSLPLLRPPGRRQPRWNAITLTAQSRVHVLACRQAHGLELWCLRDLAVRMRRVKGSPEEEPPGKKPFSHVCCLLNR